MVVRHHFVHDIGYFVRPRAHHQGTFVSVPRPRLQVDVTYGFHIEFGVPYHSAHVVHGNFRLGKQTRRRIQGAENEIERKHNIVARADCGSLTVSGIPKGGKG